MNLPDLYHAMHDAYRALPDKPGPIEREIANRTVSELYVNHFNAAIQEEGFTPKQASVIAYEAYERGHSAGYMEIVCVAQGIVSFAKELLAAGKD